MKELVRIEMKSRQAWRDWLAENHRQPDSVWVVTFKKGQGPYVAYDELVEEALCFGWIDSLPRRLDESRTMLLMSRRHAGSGWSKANKDRIARMTKAGLMADPGLTAVAGAKSDGSWTMLDVVDALEKPEDLVKALRDHRQANEYFDGFPPSVRRGILEWIAQAKRPQTRARRIHETAMAAARNERVDQWGKRQRNRA